MSNNIDETLTDLDFKSLYHYAEWHDKQATILRTRAQKLQERQNMRYEAKLRQEFLQGIYKVVLRYLNQGKSLEEAQICTSQYTQTPLNTVQIRWNDFISDNSAKNTKEKHKAIYRLHTIGLRNVVIAKRFGIHSGSVCRILKEQKRKRLSEPNKNRLGFFLENPDNDDYKNVRVLSSRA